MIALCPDAAAGIPEMVSDIRVPDVAARLARLIPAAPLARSKCSRPTSRLTPGSSADCSAGARAPRCRGTLPSIRDWVLAGSVALAEAARPGRHLHPGRGGQAGRDRGRRWPTDGRASARCRSRILRLFPGPLGRPNGIERTLAPQQARYVRRGGGVWPRHRWRISDGRRGFHAPGVQPASRPPRHEASLARRFS